MQKMILRRPASLLLTSLLLLAACTDVSNVDNSDGSQFLPMDPGTGFTEQTVSVSRNDKDGGHVTLRFYDDMPNVAYIAATAYYRMMMPEATMTVENLGGRYLLRTADASATVDVVADVLTSSQYCEFVSMMSLIGPGLPPFETSSSPYIKYDSHQYDPAGATVTLDFAKYDIDLRDDGREVFFPFATINDIFSDVYNHMACYDGSDILVNVDSDVFGLNEIDKEYASLPYSSVEVGEDLARLRYAELCFVIDNFYGYPGRNILESLGLRQYGLEATLDGVDGGKEVKALLQSRNQAEFIVGMDALNWLMTDGVDHTKMGISANAPESAKEDFMARYEEARQRASAAVNQMIEMRAAVEEESRLRKLELSRLHQSRFGDGRYIKSADGQTAMYTFMLFDDINQQGWRTYYASNRTDADWQALVGDKEHPDNVVEAVELLKRARKEGVKNLIIDITQNIGGDDDPTNTIAALFGYNGLNGLGDNGLGDRTALLSSPRKHSSWEMNMLTRQFLTKNFVVDRNFDGQFDERDDLQDWVGDMNIVLLTADVTFSNANVFAAKMEAFGYPIWGQRSGGGACSIQDFVTPDGMAYTISSCRSHSTDSSGKSIDGGIAVDKILDDAQLFDIEYLNSLFR